MILIRLTISGTYYNKKNLISESKNLFSQKIKKQSVEGHFKMS